MFWIVILLLVLLLGGAIGGGVGGGLAASGSREAAAEEERYVAILSSLFVGPSGMMILGPFRKFALWKEASVRLQKEYFPVMKMLMFD